MGTSADLCDTKHRHLFSVALLILQAVDPLSLDALQQDLRPQVFFVGLELECGHDHAQDQSVGTFQEAGQMRKW